jgi:hypothetical protein
MPNRRELAPASYTAPDRPAVLHVDGGTIYLHIHDAEYMRLRSHYRARLLATHPDHGGTRAQFQSILRARQSWQAREVLWYARLGLLPPDGAEGSTAVRSARLRALRRTAPTSGTRALASATARRRSTTPATTDEE